MYIKESGLTQAIDVINQGNKFIAERAGFADQVMREKAKSDLFYAEAEFNKNTQEFLRDLSTKNDYPNFGKYLDNYLTEQSQALQKKAKNHYSGELFNQMITSQRNALENTVQNQVLALQIKDITTQNQGAIQLNRNNLSGQNGINANNPIFNYEFAKGMRDSNYTRAALLDDGTKNIEKELLTDCESLMQKLYVNGGDFSQVEKYIDDTLRDNEYQIMMLDDKYASEEGLKYAEEHPDECYMNIGNEVDKKSIGDNMKKTLKTRWKTEIDEMQEKNFGFITEMLVEFDQLSPTQQLDYAAYALKKIETDFSGNRLNPSQRAQATKFFTTALNGKNTKKASNDLIKELDLKVKNNMKFFINRYTKGDLDAYGARDAFEQQCFNDFKELTGSENKTEMLLKCPTIENFLDELYKNVPEEIQSVVDVVKNKVVNLAKDLKLENIEQYESGIIDLCFDTLATVKLSNPKRIEEVKNELLTEANSLDGKKLDIIRANIKTGNMGLEIGISGKEKALYNYLSEIRNHPHFVYKDKNGVVKPSVFANGTEGFERAADLESSLLMKEFGITDQNDFGKRFKMQFEQDPFDAEEVNANHVFVEDANGVAKYWKFVPDSKTKSLKLYSKTGNGKWVEEKRSVQVEKEEKVDSRNELLEEIKPLAEKIDLKTARSLKLSGPWEKRLAVKDYKWVANQIANMIGEYNSTKDKRKKEELKSKLKVIGYEVE